MRTPMTSEMEVKRNSTLVVSSTPISSLVCQDRNPVSPLMPAFLGLKFPNIFTSSRLCIRSTDIAPLSFQYPDSFYGPCSHAARACGTHFENTSQISMPFRVPRVFGPSSLPAAWTEYEASINICCQCCFVMTLYYHCSLCNRNCAIPDTEQVHGQELTKF
jgi:hypothetical protein